MYYSNSEIIDKRAGDSTKEKKEQIQILADLNGCSQEAIRSILKDAGMKLPPGPPLKKKQQTEEKPVKKAEKKKEETKAKETTKQPDPKTGKEPGVKEEILPDAVRNALLERGNVLFAERKRIDQEIEEISQFLNAHAFA